MNTKALISAIKDHIKGFDGKQVKAFYENDLGFTDVFTEEDNYMDFFESDMYLESHIKGNEDMIETKLKTLNINIEYNPDDIYSEIIAEKLIKITIDGLPIETSYADKIKIMLQEASKMAKLKSYLGVIIFVGSILEAIIRGMLENDPTKTGKLQSDFKTASGKDYLKSLNELLTTANKVGMYNGKANEEKAHIIRIARNYVHPNKQIEKKDFTSTDAFISVGCLVEIIDSFKKYKNYI